MHAGGAWVRQAGSFDRQQRWRDSMVVPTAVVDPYRAARPSAGAGPRRAGGTRLLYIGGLGRSGSTLLDRMLGELPGVVALGEVRDLWQRGLVENRLCGCGEPVLACPFWTAVGNEAFGGWDRVEPVRIQSLAKRVDRHRYLLGLRWPGAIPSFDARLTAYGDALGRLYAAIGEVSGADIIVDSSKAPSYFSVLQRVPGLDLSVVHLVRDSRGTAFSWNKRVERPDVVDRVASMARYNPLRVSLRWVSRNLLMEALAAGGPRLFVRYETLVEEPRGVIEQIAGMAGIDTGGDRLAFVGAGEVHLGPGHSVQGNPMRMQQGRIRVRLDDEWRSAMAPGQRLVVTAVTLPVLRRYGYRP